VCGPDPRCGASCGSCPAGSRCDETGQCQPLPDEEAEEAEEVIGGCACGTGPGSARMSMLAGLGLLLIHWRKGRRG
ncbi:MAG: hypothetical protein JXR96_10525, partial [Deltaproteobacteria bacterium]|nr:hypothetical protein [Deltaproteobacteria bacterium]